MPVHDWTRVTPNIFHDFHTAWLSEIRKSLNQGILPDDYLAALEQSAGNTVPDILTLEVDASDQELDRIDDPQGAVAVQERPPQVDVCEDIELDVVRQKQISIQHASGEVVALIELISPANKRTPENLQIFKEKVYAAIMQGIHVLVIDILPPGRHDPRGIHGVLGSRIGGNEFDLPADRPLTLASYEAGVSVRAYVQTMAVGQVFRPMPLFLRRDWYVEVPLESTYQAAWEGAPRQWRRLLTGDSEE
ncbi:MAG: DUF4058 family protein [Planctomycetaceae bacterium]|nr:DUF4058 family protein [Planctomycetaceae bacterium]